MSLMKAVSSGLKSGSPIKIFEEVVDLLGAKDMTEASSRYLRLKILETLVGEKWVRDIFTYFENPDLIEAIAKPPAIPYHPKQLAGIYFKVMDKTVEASAYLGEEMGSEAIMEMISESMSSALESNYNAALQTILNVWRGCLPPDLSVAQAMGMRIDSVDTKYATSILAPTSALPYTILESLVQGANNRLQQLYGGLDNAYGELIAQKNAIMRSFLTAFSEFYLTLINDLVFDCMYFVERVENYANTACTIILERLTARLDDLNALKARYDVGLVDSETYETMLLEIQADINALSDTFDRIKTEVSNLISDYLSVIDAISEDIKTLLLNYLADAENLANTHIDSVVSAINSLTAVSDIKAKVKEIYERIRAYRECGFDYS